MKETPPATNYQPPAPNKRIALVTDWIYGGGGEMVVLELHKIFPDAPIYTSYCSNEWRNKLDNKVVTGYLQKWPFDKLRKFLPLLRQWWFARLDLSKFDLVISITGNGEAKFVKVPNGKHLSYCHTPVHFYWRHYQKYSDNPGIKPAWLARLGLRLLVKPLRKRDYNAAQKVDTFIANSTHIKNDIKKYYNRESTVIFPPVDTTKFSQPQLPTTNPQTLSFVTHGRLVPLKHIDIAIKACNELKLPLTVIGKGPEYDNLTRIAGPTITMKGFVADKDLPTEIAKHSAYIFASFEDFGIAPVEAMAAGLPVIAYQAGGALDYVEEGKTGLFFKQQSVVDLTRTLQKFDAKLFDSSKIKKSVERFSSENFRKAIQEQINNL